MSSPFVSDHKILFGNSTFDPLGVDGIFGKATREVVKAFQRSAGLDDDGVVGPLTWEALGFNAAELKTKIKVQALMLPSGMTLSGPQGQSASECGYFSGYVVATLEKNHRDFGRLKFSREEVLTNRAIYHEWEAQYYTRERGGSGLSPGAGAHYLKFLELDGYHDTKTGLSAAPDPAAAIDALVYYMRGGNSSVMVSVPNFAGNGNGHWLAILQGKVVDHESYFLIYDTSKACPNWNKRNGLRAGEWICWFPVSTLASVFNAGGFRDVVTRQPG